MHDKVKEIEEQLDRQEETLFAKKIAAIRMLSERVAQLAAKMGPDERKNKHIIQNEYLALLDVLNNVIKQQYKVIKEKYDFDVKAEHEDVILQKSDVEKRIRRDLRKLVQLLKRQTEEIDRIGGHLDELWRSHFDAQTKAGFIKDIQKSLTKTGIFADTLIADVHREKKLFSKALKDEHHLYKT